MRDFVGKGWNCGRGLDVFGGGLFARKEGAVGAVWAGGDAWHDGGGGSRAAGAVDAPRAGVDRDCVPCADEMRCSALIRGDCARGFDALVAPYFVPKRSIVERSVAPQLVRWPSNATARPSITKFGSPSTMTQA